MLLLQKANVWRYRRWVTMARSLWTSVKASLMLTDEEPDNVSCCCWPLCFSSSSRLFTVHHNTTRSQDTSIKYTVTKYFKQCLEILIKYFFQLVFSTCRFLNMQPGYSGGKICNANIWLDKSTLLFNSCHITIDVHSPSVPWLRSRPGTRAATGARGQSRPTSVSSQQLRRALISS